jgi:hypothetical protein
VPAGLAVLGLLAGVLAKAADESGLAWAAELGSRPAVWVLAVALIGRAAPTWRAAALRAAAFFAAMTLAYYAWAAWVLGFGWNRLLPVWLVLSATAVAAASVAAWAGTRRAGALPGAAMAAAAGIALAGGSVQRLYRVWTGDLPGAAVRPVQLVVDVVVAALLVAALPRHGRTRAWAAALLVPLAALAAVGVQWLYRVTG